MPENMFPEKFTFIPDIRYIAVTDFMPDYREEWHYSHFNDLIYIISGDMTVIRPGISDLEYPVSAGEILLMKKDIRHKDIFKHPKGLKALVISYLWDGDSNFLHDSTQVIRLKHEKSLEIRNILEHICENCYNQKQKNKDFLLMQQSRLHTVLLLLYKIIHENNKESQAAFLTRTPQALLKAAEYYIRCNYSSHDLNRAQVAAALSISISTLARTFALYCSYTFTEFLTSVRLEAAKKLLNSGTCRVSEVAQLCGFSDPGYFSKVFKKAFGVPPNKYP